MADLDNHRHKLQESQDEILRLRQLVSSKDSVIKDLRASKRSVIQELEAARLATKVAEDTSTTLKAQHDKTMHLINYKIQCKYQISITKKTN